MYGLSACSVGWWLTAGGWFVLREKYCWLVADKPSEQGVCLLYCTTPTTLLVGKLPFI
jgi:hypothetical protein